MKSIANIVVLGASFAMGAAASAAFAAAGLSTVLLDSSLAAAEAGRVRAEQLAKGAITAGTISCGSYDADLARVLATGDLVFETSAEDAAGKRAMLAAIDRLR